MNLSKKKVQEALVIAGASPIWEGSIAKPNVTGRSGNIKSSLKLRGIKNVDNFYAKT